MDGIKLAVTKFEQVIQHTDDHVYYGILKRRFWDKKYTTSEWFAVLDKLKKEPVK